MPRRRGPHGSDYRCPVESPRSREASFDKGADINTKDKYGWTALTWAWHSVYGKPDLDLVKLLKDRGAKMTLTAAACLGDLKEARRLINAGADINAQGQDGRTALMIAVQGGTWKS